MDLNWDYVARLVVCIIILALGIWAYRQRLERLPLLVGIAFGLFGVYYLIVLLGIQGIHQAGILILRYVGYLIVIYGLYEAGSKRLEIKIPE